MDSTTRLVATIGMTLFGLFFLVAGIVILARGGDTLLGIIYIPLGVVWLLIVVLVVRKMPRV